MADQLQTLGYRMKTAKALKPKHIQALLDQWNQTQLTTGTIKNRLGHLRWWTEAVGKQSIMQSNTDYGIPQREAFKGNRAQKLNSTKLQAIPDAHIQISLRLMAAFGLRREEALKFQPVWADQGNTIRLKGTWTKGGRDRTIPIVTERQRSLLNEAKALVQNSQRSLIPEGKTYIQHLKRYENLTLKAGLRNNHSLRHNYAQWRYLKLTGHHCIARSGVVLDKAVDFEVRLQIARELGHGRIDVTNTYLGGRA